MTCLPKSFEDNFKNADFIFMGTVIERTAFKEANKLDAQPTKDDPHCGSKTATFEISKIWKGSNTHKTTTVYSMDACFGLGAYFEPNGHYIVFANSNEKEIPVEADFAIKTGCDGTRPIFPAYPHDDYEKQILELIKRLDEVTDVK